MYSQNDEERVILEVLASVPPGKFIDIGAYDGKTFSNVRALLERGWGGVMIEPSPTAFVMLMANTEQWRDKLMLINAAVSSKGGLMLFYEFAGDAVGTLDRAHYEKWQVGNMPPAHRLWTHTIALEELLRVVDCEAGTSFINLDVEGKNWELFRELPLHWPGLRLVCVEHDGMHAQMLQWAAPHGFRHIHHTSENLLLARQ